MININIEQLQNNFYEYIKLIETGKESEIIVHRDNNPILIVMPYTQNNKRIYGSAKGKISVPDNFDDIDISNLFEGDI